MSTLQSNYMNHVAEDEHYYICRVCRYRLGKKISDVLDHFSKGHGIEPNDVVPDYREIKMRIHKTNKHMIEYLTNQLTFIGNGSGRKSDKWQCKHCPEENAKKFPASEAWSIKYKHLKDKHLGILEFHGDDRSMPGSSSSTGNIIARPLSRNESPTPEMSSNISEASQNEVEEVIENVNDLNISPEELEQDGNDDEIVTSESETDAKPESSGTDPVDGNSSRDADRPLPDSSTTSSNMSSVTALLEITGPKIRSMNTEEKKEFLWAVTAQFYEKRE